MDAADAGEDELTVLNEFEDVLVDDVFSQFSRSFRVLHYKRGVNIVGGAAHFVGKFTDEFSDIIGAAG